MRVKASTGKSGFRDFAILEEGITEMMEESMDWTLFDLIETRLCGDAG
jgi:hypothetical protein